MCVFDGVVRTLTRVMHVPKLKKNMISLGTLDSSRYRCSIRSGVMRVFKGRRAFLQGKMIGGLYRLVGRVEIGVHGESCRW